MRLLSRFAPCLLLLALLACAPAIPAVAPTAQPAQQENPTALPMPTQIPEPTATPPPSTLVPAPTEGAPAPYPTSQQPVTIGAAPADLPGVLAAIPQTLQEYGGDLGALYARLQEWKVLDEQPGFREYDLDGDGKPEVLLTLMAPVADPQAAPLSGPRALVVLGQEGSGWALRDSKLYDQASNLAVPRIADLTGDGRPDLVVTYQDCGAHTCFLTVDVLSYEGGRLQSRLPQPLSQSYADMKLELRDGKPTLALHGGEIGSVGAGPVQARTDYYAWDGQGFRRVDTVWDPSNLRLHVYQAGDRALRKGDLKGAAELYQRVISDATLLQTGMADEKAERHALEAFSYYRLVTVYAALGDRGAAQKALDALKKDYADHPCLALAQAFWDAWEPTGNVSAGCAAATAYAAEHEADVGGSFGYYGYANPLPGVGDFCFLK